MSKRRKRLRHDDAPPPERHTGVAALLSERPAAKLDLHGLTALEAERRVRTFLELHRRTSPGRVVHVITGKGTRSAGPAVLWDLVRDLLEGAPGRDVEEWAGLVGGGGWAVRLAE